MIQRDIEIGFVGEAQLTASTYKVRSVPGLFLKRWVWTEHVVE